MSDSQAYNRLYAWDGWARPEQQPPPGDWTTWLLMGGRGSGKTRAGAEWVRSLAKRRVGPIALVGETMVEAIEIMVRGESGILAIHPEEERPTLKGNRLAWTNGIEAQILSGSDPERFRGPQFAAAWCDELGCGAVDKGANQPNIFGDDKSAEGGRPYFSSGMPDGLMQRQFLRAHHRFWSEPQNNPAGMVDPDRIYCWTWDARPFPSFPALEDVWADGPNHRTGHWLTGRLGAMASDELIGAIADDHGVSVMAQPAAPLLGGVVVNGPGTVREAIEPVLEMTGQKLLARDGELVGLVRGTTVVLDPDTLAEGDGPVVSRRRGATAELPGRLALSHFDRERDYLTATATALRPGNGPLATQSLAVVLDGAAARLTAERLLDGRTTGGDRIEVALPPGEIGIEPGDRIGLPGLAEGPFEVTEIRDGPVRRIAATAVMRGDAVATGVSRTRGGSGVPAAAVAPLVVVAHLPARPDDPSRTRLVLGAFAKPWPGAVRVMDEATGAVLSELKRPAPLGTVLVGMDPGPLAVWDRANAFDIELRSGHLADVTEAAALSGSNRLVVETTTGGWEVIGFAEAELLAPGQYRLRRLLRGQEGTETAAIASGAKVMVLDKAVGALPVDLHWIGASRTLRIEAGQTVREIEVVLGIEPALPLSPVHLQSRRQADGSVVLGWTRRSRADGDGWGVAEPGLEHVPEAWRIEIQNGSMRVRTLTTTTASAVYGAGEQMADFGTQPSTFDFTVAQVSASLGPGIAARETFNG